MNEKERLDLLATIDKEIPWVIDLRRQLHRIPELGNQEIMTCEKIKEILTEINIPFRRVLETGIIADIKIEKNCDDLQSKKSMLFGKEATTRTIALRGELDGLPICEETGLPYSSISKGRMHACGHDVHMAIMLGTAKVLQNLNKQLQGTVRLIFQPAEETTGGAERMIEKGCLQDVDAILGMHIFPNLPANTIGIKGGCVHPCSLMFKITIEGKSCHGAYPHHGVDAILIASQIISNSQSIISRNFNPLDGGLISFGQIHGGSAKNIIADEVVLEGILRAFGNEEIKFLKNRLEKVAQLTAEGQGGDVVFEFEEGYPVMSNDGKITDILRGIINSEETLNVEELEAPTMGVDDFAYFSQKIPGAMCFLGAGFPKEENKIFKLHSKNLMVNEECIRAGIMLNTLAVMKLLYCAN